MISHPVSSEDLNLVKIRINFYYQYLTLCWIRVWDLDKFVLKQLRTIFKTQHVIVIILYYILLLACRYLSTYVKFNFWTIQRNSDQRIRTIVHSIPNFPLILFEVRLQNYTTTKLVLFLCNLFHSIVPSTIWIPCRRRRSAVNLQRNRREDTVVRVAREEISFSITLLSSSRPYKSPSKFNEHIADSEPRRVRVLV